MAQGTDRRSGLRPSPPAAGPRCAREPESFGTTPSSPAGRLPVLAALSAGATSGLLVVLASDWLGVGASGFGLLLSAIGGGAAGGPLLLHRFIRPGDKCWLFGPLALRGVVDLALAGFRQPVVAGGALALYGVGTSTGMVAHQSTVQSGRPA